MYNKISPERKCYKCGYTGQLRFNDVPHAQHGYKFYCQKCGCFLAWGGRNKALRDEHGKRDSSTIWTHSRLKMDYCQLCGRSKNFVDAVGEQLESHHLQPIFEGGVDEPKNIIVLCTACHKEVHHRRIYFQEHIQCLFFAWEKDQEARSYA